MRAADLDMRFANSRGGPLLAVGNARGPRLTPTHAHARGQIFGARSGVLTITTEMGRWVVPATHAVWMPPRRPHGVEMFGDYDGFSAYIEHDACGDLPGAPFAFRVSALLRAGIERAAMWSGKRLSDVERNIAMVVLDELRSAHSEPFGLAYPTDPAARRIAEHVIANLRDSRTLAALAKEAGTTTRTAARHFAAETGFTFTHWRQRARVLASLERLAAGASVLEVSLDLGYENQSAFIAMFRRVTGETPGRYK